MTSRIATFLLLSLALVFVSCKKSEDSKSGVFGRIVTTDGSVDGVVVKIYNIPDQANPSSDASVWSVTDAEDQVGFPFKASYGFDHRLYNSIMQDTVNGDGEFQFKNVVAGDYFVVAEIQGLVWSVPQDLHTSGGDVDMHEIELPQVVDYGEQFYNFDEDVTFESGTHYLLHNNTQVLAGVTLTIQPGAVVRLAGAKSLQIRGTMICRGTPDNYIQFLPLEVVSRDPDEWQQVKFRPIATPPDIAYTVFRHGSTALDLETNGGVVEYCHFYKFSGEGVLARYEPPRISHCIFERNGYGIYNTATSGLDCEHNLFQTCDPFAITLYNKSDCDLFCNWFRNCGGSDTSGSGARGVIKLDLVNNSEIHNNHFETSWFAFQVGSWVDSTTYIHHNNFTRMNTVMNINVTEDQRGPSNPLFKYNCFSTVDRFIIYYNCNQHNYRDMDATSNSWGTTSLSFIADHYIHDRQDDGTCPIVNYSPVLNSCSEILTQTGTAAGICQ